MSYIDQTLLSDERCFHRLQPHWVVYSFSIIMFVLAILISFHVIRPLNILASYQFRGYSYLKWLSFIFFVIAAYQGLAAWLNRKSSEYGITNKRILMKRGFIQRDTMELFLDKIEAVHIDQSILGRIFNYGTLIVVGTGGSRDPFSHVPAPLMFRRKVQEQIDSFLHDKRS